jgi:uncharacterized delta-60 repeat protein/uncharacterized repeat protein (TIGR01451 family)
MVAAIFVGSTLINRVIAAAGDLDPSFGTGGIAITDFGFSSRADSILIQADGKLVVAGTGGPSGAVGILIARYNPNGSLDSSFGSSGKTITDFGLYELVAGAALDATGRIVVAGMADNDKIFLARYKTDGNLDATFGTDSKGMTPILAPFFISDMALQADGKIVVAGHIKPIPTIEMNTGWDFLVVRYTATGSLDASFGNDGFVRTDFNQPLDAGHTVLIQNDGKILVSGFSNPEGGNSFSFVNSDFCMARYHPDGSLDSTFGTGGKVVSNFAVGTSCIESVLQNDGKIILVGSAWNNTNREDFALARYNANGSLDTSFGNGGLVLTDFGGTTYLDDSAISVALQEDGKIVVAGNNGGLFDSALARYNPDGTLDTSFGAGGKVITSIDEQDAFTGVAIYGGERIVTCAVAQHGVPQPNGSIQWVGNFALARYQVDGTPASADLAVTLTASQPTNFITYTITVTNYGFDPSYYVTLKDTLPANTTFVSFTAPSGWVVYSKPGLGQSGTVSVSRAKMVASHHPFTSSATFTLVVRLSSAASGTTISNRAYVSSGFTPDPYGANDRDIVYTSVP